MFLTKKELKKLKKNGIKFENINNVLIANNCEFGKNISIGSNVKIINSIIMSNVSIANGSVIVNSKIATNTMVNASEITDSCVGESCTIGPYAHIKQKSELSDNIRVGNFVEIKNSKIKNGTKIAHLAYVGDADVGQRVNVGCGVVFANFDGKKKHKSVVGNDVFIGCNCNLVAPIKIGDGVFIAAGTTVTTDIEENKFCIGRTREMIKNKNNS